MVPRPRLLLSFLLALAGAGCKAETVGVELPKGGPDSISQEDLQRDIWMITQIPDRARQVDALAEGVQRRLQQMHTRPGFDRSYVDSDGAGARVLCAEKSGGPGAPVLVLAEDVGTSVAEGAAPVAVLISLFKGLDTLAPPPRTVVGCALLGPGARERLLSHPPVPLSDVGTLFLLGPFGPEGDTLAEESGTLGEVGARRLRLGGTPSPDKDTLESLDYRVLREATVEAHGRIVGSGGGG